MHIKGVEEESDTLIDDDAETCVKLTGSDGCTMDRVKNCTVLSRVENLFIMFSYSDKGIKSL